MQEAAGSLNLLHYSLGQGAVVCLERMPGWDPFLPASPPLPAPPGGEAAPPPPVSLLMAVAGDTAAVWRIQGGQVEARVDLVAR